MTDPGIVTRGTAAPHPTVPLLGGTGRTGGRVLAHLLEHGIGVRAIVRSVSRLPVIAGDDASPEPASGPEPTPPPSSRTA